jgi:hypothetical protein
MHVKITKTCRQAEVGLVDEVKKIKIKASRLDCRDVLVEFVNKNGHAKSMPLNKSTGKLFNAAKISLLRFILNEMSVKPVEITIELNPKK